VLRKLTPFFKENSEVERKEVSHDEFVALASKEDPPKIDGTDALMDRFFCAFYGSFYGGIEWYVGWNE